MNDTLANGTNSSIPFTSSADDTSQPAILVTIHSINFILGLPVNSYVLWLILSGAGGTTIASEFFYLNLIVSMTISSLASALIFAWLFTHDSILYTVLHIAFVLFFVFPAPLFQCCVCVERYVAVVHPVVFLRYKALRYRVACCCAAWLTALTFGLIYNWLERIARYIHLGYCAACISVVCFCCLSVLRALKRPGPGEGQRDGAREGNDLKRRAFRTILVSLVVMSTTTMSYIPTILLYLLNYFFPVAVAVTNAIAIVVGFAHPLLYMHKAGKLPCFKGL